MVVEVARLKPELRWPGCQISYSSAWHYDAAQVASVMNGNLALWLSDDTLLATPEMLSAMSPEQLFRGDRRAIDRSVDYLSVFQI